MTIVRRSIRINHANKKNIRCSPRRSSSRSKNSLFGSKYCSYQTLKNKSTNSRKILSSKRSDERKQKEIQKEDSITIKKEVDSNYDIILKVLRSGPIIKEEYDQVKKSMTQCKKPTCYSNQVEMMMVDKTPVKKSSSSRQAESFTTPASTMLRKSPRLNKPSIRRSDRLKKYSSEKRQVPRVGRIF